MEAVQDKSKAPEERVSSVSTHQAHVKQGRAISTLRHRCTTQTQRSTRATDMTLKCNVNVVTACSQTISVLDQVHLRTSHGTVLYVHSTVRLGKSLSFPALCRYRSAGCYQRCDVGATAHAAKESSMHVRVGAWLSSACERDTGCKFMLAPPLLCRVRAG